MMKKKTEGAAKTATGAVLTLPAELKIRNNEKMLEKLKSAKVNYTKIVIDLSRVENIDLSSIQILLSFYKECLMDDLKVDFRGPLQEMLRKKLQGCGFLETDGFEEILFPFMGKKGAKIGNH